MSAAPTTDHLDATPSSNDLRVATLMFGEQRFTCHFIDVSNTAFRVTVPWSREWKTDPRARLLTRDAAYAVKIVKQEPHRNGMRLTLIQIDETELLAMPQRWIVHASRCCAIGLIAALVYCCVIAPSSNSLGAKTASLKGLSDFWHWWCLSAAVHEGLAAGTSSNTKTTQDTDLLELPSISVTLASRRNDRREESANHRIADDPQAAAIAAATRLAQIKQAYKLAQMGLVQVIDSKSLPWLFFSGQYLIAGEPAIPFRATESAVSDLAAFESGLELLNESNAVDAVRSLRLALRATITPSTFVLATEELPAVRRICSDDAEIYFRMTSEAVEILRVLPRAFTDPTSSAPHDRPVSRSAGR